MLLGKAIVIQQVVDELKRYGVTLKQPTVDHLFGKPLHELRAIRRAVNDNNKDIIAAFAR